MSSPIIPSSPPPASSGSGAAPAASEAERQQPASRPRRLVGALAGLFGTRSPAPVDLSAPLRAGIQVAYGGEPPRATGAANVAGVLGDEAWAREAVHALFPGMPDDLAPGDPPLAQLLEPHTMDPRLQPLPRYGNAPRYANGVLFANALAQATGGDWQAAQHLLGTWHEVGAQGTEGAGGDETRAAHFTAHCALARTESGRDVLDALGSSPHWQHDGEPPMRLQATLMLAASGDLIEHARRANLSALPDNVQHPRNLDDAARLAQAVLDAEPPDADTDPLAAAAHGRAVIAARTLQGIATPQPSLAQREAITLFRGALAGHGVADCEQLGRARNRVNRLWGDGDKAGWWARVRGQASTPVSERRVIGALMQSSIQGLRERLHERLARPTQAENGRQVPDVGVVTDLDDDIVRDAVEYGVLGAVAGRIDRKGEFRDTVRLRGAPGAGWLPGAATRPSRAERHALREAAALLGVEEDALREHRVWRAGWDELGTRGASPHPGAFGASDLAAYMDRAGLAPDDALRRPLETAQGLQAGIASRNDAMRTLVQTMQPGSKLAFTSQGVLGINTTWWSTFGLKALSRWPVVPTVCPLPTVARVKGRGAAVVLSGDEGPEGGYVDIHSGTFERTQLTGLLGLIAQAHDHGNHNFVWLIGETGGHRHDESYEGVTIRVKGRDFAEARERAGAVLETLAHPKGGAGGSAWQNLVDDAYLDPDTLVGMQTRHTEARARIKLQLMGLIGQNLPIVSEVGLPDASWAAPAVQYSRTEGTQLTSSQGMEQIVNPQFRRERHVGTGALVYPIPVFFDVGALANQLSISGGHGALYIPLGRTSKTLAYREATLVLPGQGVESAPYREFTMDEDTWLKWSMELGGAAQPQPPAFARRDALPDAGAARGARDIVVRQYLTPAAQAQWLAYQRIATMLAARDSSDPQVQQEQRKWDGLTGELLGAEASWGVTEVWDQHTTRGGRTGGPPPWFVQAQAPQTLERRERRHIGGRQGGRSALVGTRYPESGASAEYARRVAARNLPQQIVDPQPWIPVVAGTSMPPMQYTIAQIFEYVPQEPRVEPERVPAQGNQFGLLSESSAASTRPVQGDEQVPQADYRDRLTDAEDLLAAGDHEGARQILSDMADRALKFGVTSNGLRTYFFEPEQAHAFGQVAERYADATGDERFLASLAPAMLASWRAAMRGADDQMVPGRIYNGLVMLGDGRLLNMRHDYREAAQPQRDSDDDQRDLARSISLQENAQWAEYEYALMRALRAADEPDLAGLMLTWHIQRLQAMRDAFFAPAAEAGPLTQPGAQQFGVPLMAGSHLRLGAGAEGGEGAASGDAALQARSSAQIANALWVRGLAPQEAIDGIAHELERELTPRRGQHASPAHERAEPGLDEERAADTYKAVVGLLRHKRYTAAQQIAVGFAENAWQDYAQSGATHTSRTTNEALRYFASMFPQVREILERPRASQ